MNIPVTEVLKSIPGTFGIRLEQELPYTLVQKIGDIEIRFYPSFTLARTKAEGSMEESENESFSTLANFIFGNNSEKKKTSMTTPVFMDQDTDGWTMSFYITEENAHLVPADDSIWIEEMPDKMVAVYRYSGTNDLESMKEAEEHLLECLVDEGMKTTSKVWWAQYDQPFSIPAFKRNEALVKVDL